MDHTKLSLLLLAGFAGMTSTTRADVVTDWNASWRNAVHDTGGGPTITSRTAAMMNVAMFDAMNSIEGRYTPYHFHTVAPGGTSIEAAMATAAHRVLTLVLPSHALDFDALYASHLAAIPDGLGKINGIALGSAAADDIIALRANDGSNDNTPYTPGTQLGDWQPTDGLSPLGANWWHVTPWVVPDPTAFRPPPPPDIHSHEYAVAYNETKALGRRTGSTRTQEQTDIAHFWGNDVLGTYLPPGHLNSIMAEICGQQGLTLSQNSRVFTLISLAMADACIVAWDVKYHMGKNLWRPVTAIHMGDVDENPETTADPDWVQLGPFTPPFPSYISGHATFGSVHAAIVRQFFGTDNIQFVITSEDPFYTAGARTYNSFTDAARENGRSRVYLGVHFQFDSTEGFNVGQNLGTYVYQHVLRPLCIADVDDGTGQGVPDSSVTIDDLLYYLAKFEEGNTRADVDDGSSTGTPDGGVTIEDLLYFLTRFEAGC